MHVTTRQLHIHVRVYICIEFVCHTDSYMQQPHTHTHILRHWYDLAKYEGWHFNPILIAYMHKWRIHYTYEPVWVCMYVYVSMYLPTYKQIKWELSCVVQKCARKGYSVVWRFKAQVKFKHTHVYVHIYIRTCTYKQLQITYLANTWHYSHLCDINRLFTLSFLFFFCYCYCYFQHFAHT